MDEKEAEIWADELCTVCKEVFDTEERKSKHRATPKHIQKVKLHTFLAEELGKSTTKSPSRLLERYQLNNVPVVGLNDLVEIQHFGVSNHLDKADFWICSICYEAGSNLEQADAHLQSLKHISNFFEENEPDIAAQISAELPDPTNQCDRYEALRSHAHRHFIQNRPLQSPETCRMTLCATDGRKKFDLNEKSVISFQPRKDDGLKSIMSCSTCTQVIPVHTPGKHSNDKAKNGHLEHPSHLRCASILAVIREFEPTEIYDEYNTTESYQDLHWNYAPPTDTYYVSQPVGYRYSYKAGTETICAICFCLVHPEELEEHFKSEFHVMRFLPLVMNSAGNAFIGQHLRGEPRRAHALHMLQSSLTLENDTKMLVKKLDRFPRFLKEQLAQDIHRYEEPEMEVVDKFVETTGKIHVMCRSCTTYIEFDAKLVDTPEKLDAAWLRHVSGALHFETAAMKARVYFDPQFCVPYPSTFSNPDNMEKGEWSMCKDILIQNQCDIGLEYMVEDETEDEVVCQCCWQIFSKNLLTAVNTHIRSYDHLKQYIFHNKLELTELTEHLLREGTDEHKRNVLMRFLQENSGKFPKHMFLYSKFKALELNAWSPISRQIVQTACCSPGDKRDVFEALTELVDNVADDGGDKTEISAKDALLTAQMHIIHTHRADKELKSLVCKCLPCEQLIVVNCATWQTDVFANHTHLDEHHRRAEQINQNIISVYGIAAEPASYTVKPFMQKDPNKKVVWQWNPQTKSHEYVSTVVGLDEILEVRHRTKDPISPIKAEFYCQVCAKRFPKRAAELEQHVRGVEHCLNYVQKHRITVFRELHELIQNQHQDKGKELRKFLSGMLREVDMASAYCIKVYDPEGEDLRIQMEAWNAVELEKKQLRLKETQAKLAKDKERLREEIEKKRLLEEERKKVERQKQLEVQQRAQQMLAEREARLQYAQGNVKNYGSSDDSELQNRLQKASMMERQKTLASSSHPPIDIQQKRLEAERIQLLGKLPGASKDPQLVIMPNLKSKPPPPAIPIMNQFVPPPSIQNQAYAGYGSYQQPPPSNPYANHPDPGFSMTFNQRPPSLAIQKRPSLRGQIVDEHIHDASRITNKSDLLKYMHSRQASNICDAEIPREFSRMIQECPDAFGVDYVAEVICMDDPNLDSYLCTLCNAWAAPQGMYRHLTTTEHKYAFLQNKHLPYYREIAREKNLNLRRNIVKNFTDELKRKDIGSQIHLRMNTLIDKRTIERLWPGYEDHFRPGAPMTNWSTGGFQEVSAPPIITLDESFEESSEDDRKKRGDRDYRKRERSRSRDRRRSRSRSRSRERRRRRSSRSKSRSRSRSRSRDRDRDRRDRSRSRDRHRNRGRDGRDGRDRSRSRSRSSSRKPRGTSYTEQTDSFLSKLQDKVKNRSRDDEEFGKSSTTRMDAFGGTGKCVSTPLVTPQTQMVDEKRLAREKEEMEATTQRKTMAAMFLMEQLIQEKNGDVPRDAILQTYYSLGLKPEDGDREINRLLDNMRNEKKFKSAPAPAPNINQSLSSFGIQLNRSGTQFGAQGTVYPPQQQQQPQYGISNTTSAYSQAFYAQQPTVPSVYPPPTVPPTVPTTVPTTTVAPPPSQSSQSFYQNPPTAMDHGESSKKKDTVVISSDSEADDDEYSEVYALIGKDKKKEAEPEKPIIPGQKMALKRTILPSGARVGEEESPVKIASPAPQAPPTIQKPQAPPPTALETSFGMPTPIAINKPVAPTPAMVQQPPPQPVYQAYPAQYATQPPPQPQYAYPGYPQQTYQQMAPPPVQYGAQPVYQQWPPQQQQHPQYAPPPQQMVYGGQQYQAPPPPQQYYAPPTSQAAQQYGIGGQTQQFYYPGR